MNKAEYAEYQQTVANFFEQEGIQNLSSISGEPYFSGNPCDCCGTSLAGDREDANGWNSQAQEVQEYSVCTDCIYYAEYNQLDDMTMMEIKKSID